MAAPDPILGVTEAFVADRNPRKVNLGVGVYYDESGKIPLLECVRHAESERLKSVPHRGYLPIDGLGAYDKAVQAPEVMRDGFEGPGQARHRQAEVGRPEGRGVSTGPGTEDEQVGVHG